MAEILLAILISVVIILVLYLIKTLSKKPEKTDILGQIISKLSELTTIFKEKEEQREKLDKAREERETQRMTQLDNFMRTISGTSRRGGVGEEILKAALVEPIKSGLIKTNLNVDGKQVEFAWNLGDGKYIPIDSKLPEVFDVYKEYQESENIDEQKLLKKKIKDKVRNHIKEIKKYQNKKNTINKVILTLPDGIVDMIPELVSEIKEEGVAISGYKNVFLYGYLMEEEYKNTKELGEVGDYRIIIKDIIHNLKEIESKAKTIDTSITTLSNANDSIKRMAIESQSRCVIKPKKRK
ncbi:MAG: DNA recombination protein RmuC [Nanoarchaeota archaeon]|nr:DNA recombination protein RmuC [Nanoarchaeota archaeon]